MTEFLPLNKEDMRKRGWERLDFVLVSGDAYVDHPSFGAAVIGRVLESKGYRVGIIAQPAWQDTAAFKALGRPRLAFLVTAGNIDSMVNHYTAAKKKRSTDLYAPGGESGYRPDRASIVYTQRIKEAYKKMPVILGGLEASLRRFAHYDYWTDRVRRSILLDAKADLLVYGMGERQIIEIAEALESGLPVAELTFLKGTVYKTDDRERPYEPLVLPAYDQILSSKEKFGASFLKQYQHTDAVKARTLVEPYGNLYVVQNPPPAPMTERELDHIYELPYTRRYHPQYEKAGGVPAIKEVKFSLISNRGCFGSCSFCALHFHQGRVVQSRSHDSILSEAAKITRDPDFKGYIHDVGGPTANFRHRACEKQLEHGVCRDRQCLSPRPCKQLKIDHQDYLTLLRKLRQLPGVKKVFVRSGLRYDYLIYDRDDLFFRELCEHHISGQLKVAPEHVSPVVLKQMGKPRQEIFARFAKKYAQINKNLGLQQFLVPYFMSGHPGASLQEAVELAEYLKANGYRPEQVQDFYPTPGTLSTCIYYTELNPITGEKVYVPKSPHEKALQRALMQYYQPRNYKLVYEALVKAGRKDLIGYAKKCLIRPAAGGKKHAKNPKQSGRKEKKVNKSTRGKNQNKKELKMHGQK